MLLFYLCWRFVMNKQFKKNSDLTASTKDPLNWECWRFELYHMIFIVLFICPVLENGKKKSSVSSAYFCVVEGSSVSRCLYQPMKFTHLLKSSSNLSTFRTSKPCQADLDSPFLILETALEKTSPIRHHLFACFGDFDHITQSSSANDCMRWSCH